MSEPIKLKVPATPEMEFVGQGNFHAELVPNSTIEVKDRKFADWLILRHGLTEIKPRKKAEKAEVNSFGYAPEFPGRDALIAAEIPFETIEGLTAEQLQKIPNISEATAEQIIGFTAVATPAVPVEVESADKSEDETEENDGGAK
jgi:hypothetical protein